MNDPIEHATGLEKYELVAKQQGNDVSTHSPKLNDRKSQNLVTDCAEMTLTSN